MKSISKTKMFTVVSILCVVGIAFGGGVLAYSASMESTYDDEHFVYDADAEEVVAIELPARQTVEDMRAPAVLRLFERNETRELEYDGSWNGNNVRTDQYTDNQGGRYMFDGRTGNLCSMSFSYSAEEQEVQPPENITKEDVVALAESYMNMYLPYAEQYALREWEDFTDDDDGEYNGNAYSVRYAIPVAEGWYFEASASFVMDSCGRLDSMVLPKDNTYALMTAEEREAIARALPTAEEWEERMHAYMIERYCEGSYEITKHDSQVITKTDEGYLLSVVFAAEIQNGWGETYIAQQIYEEEMVL